MKPRLVMCVTAVFLFAAMVIPARMTAQQDQKRGAEHHKYKLIDLGTFGGPVSYFPNGFDGIINNRATVVGWSDTSTPDPYSSFCFDPDCFVSHAFEWQKGALTDLGTLPGGASSQAIWISPNG
jgi:probable HAF family extracellular repeat protein